MRIAERRPPNRCLPPILLESVVDDPESIRRLAQENGPYFQRGYPGVIWPIWSADWATQGKPLIPAAAPLLHHEGFATAAARMCGTGRVVPEAVYINLSTPSVAQPVSHTDVPVFRGVDHSNAPGWFLQAMGTSGFFEAQRITTITAVAWFFAGECGFFRYWPKGREGESVRHEVMWNTAVVGDNDFMHHKVERVGPENLKRPTEMTGDTSLCYEGDQWILVEDGRTLECYADDHVRLSVSWKAKVYEEDSGADPIALDDVFARFADAVGDDFAACSSDELFSDGARRQLMARWPGFRPD